MHSLDNTTARISEMVVGVPDEIWRFELAALAAQNGASERASGNPVVNFILQIAAFKLAIATLGWLILRYGGTPPRKAQRTLASAATIAAIHGENTTRTRHLRGALIQHKEADPDQRIPILILGRPSSTLRAATAKLDETGDLHDHPVMRPLSFGSYLCAIPAMIGQMFGSIGQAAKYRGTIPLRDRIAIAYRFAQGAAHARWWGEAAKQCAVDHALFGHTGTADTSQLERAMQAQQTRTVHVVHGTNIGWPFAGLSDLAVFPSGADARLAATLPAYGRTAALPLQQPEVSTGNGRWALLTSYTHLQHPAYREAGAAADIALAGLVSEAAKALSHDPAKIFWRPHPQIELVDPVEKAKLEQAIADARFTRWPDDLPYEALGEFAAVVTSPSTVLTDALRLGQPAIVASLTPMQSDLLYAAHPLLVHSAEGLEHALERILNREQRLEEFEHAWSAILPGDHNRITRILAAARGKSCSTISPNPD